MASETTVNRPRVFPALEKSSHHYRHVVWNFVDLLLDIILVHQRSRFMNLTIRAKFGISINLQIENLFDSSLISEILDCRNSTSQFGNIQHRGKVEELVTESSTVVENFSKCYAPSRPSTNNETNQRTISFIHE